MAGSQISRLRLVVLDATLSRLPRCNGLYGESTVAEMWASERAAIGPVDEVERILITHDQAQRHLCREIIMFLVKLLPVQPSLIATH